MKKSFVLALLGVAAAGLTASYGQGTVTFSNYILEDSPTINYGPNSPAGKIGVPVGGTFAAELGWFNGVTADPLQITLLPASITGFGFFGPSFPNATTDG